MNQTTLLQRLTLEEKCALLSGKGEWETWNLPRAGVPSLVCSDGPHGIRRQAGTGDHLGLNPSLPATCFPTAATVAGSWDPELAEEIGRALGEEAAVQGVNIVLGPGLNIKRSPLCGRNFEYFSEDPYLSGKMAAGYIRGIQSQGVYACPKHFAVNSQELRRMAMNAVVDERTLREIYLTGFEIAVSEGHPGALMTSYNQVNGSYAPLQAEEYIDYPRLRDKLDLAERAMKRSDFRLAHDYIDEAKRIAPEDRRVFFLNGKIYDAENRYEEALEEYRNAMLLAPYWAENYYRYGQALVNLGEQQDALFVLERMQYLFPNDKWTGKMEAGYTFVFH